MLVPALCGVVALCLTPLWRWAVSLHTTAITSRRESLTGSLALTALAVGTGWRLGATPALAVWLWALLCGTVLAVTDLRDHTLPRAVLGGMATGAVVGFTALDLLGDNIAALRRALLASAAMWLVMRIIESACGGRMGGGDTRLHAVLALHTGQVSWQTVLVGFVAGSVVLGCTAGLALLWRRGSWASRVPAGPSLLTGAWIALMLTGP